jgi:hypothetical protein
MLGVAQSVEKTLTAKEIGFAWMENVFPEVAVLILMGGMERGVEIILSMMHANKFVLVVQEAVATALKTVLVTLKKIILLNTA